MELVMMLLRWMHFLFGITWIGLLYYFNFVQGPFLGQTDAATRGAVTQQLVPRALWWFRWSALGTFVFGFLMLAYDGQQLGSDFLHSSFGVAILTGAVLGTIMLANVWLVIWPNQRRVIAAATGEGGIGVSPGPAAAARRSFLVSRTDVLFSIPMLFFMGAARHYQFGAASVAGLWAWLIVGGLLVAACEVNALVATEGATVKPIESIPGVIHAGLGLTVVLFFLVWAAG